MTATSKNVYFDVLDDIVNIYNNTIHRTIKRKPIKVKNNSFAEYIEESNKRNPKFKDGDHVRISKYKNIFAKGYTPNWSEEIFVIKKVKNTVPWTLLLTILIVKRLLKVFMKKNCRKLIKKNLEQKNYLKEKVINCMLKLKGYDNSFKSWINKKDIL